MTQMPSQHPSKGVNYYQTRNLSVEIWQTIFRETSDIPEVDEFTTRSRAHNRIPWDEDEDLMTGIITPEELSAALKIRLAITRVCTAWYRMGIQILYSHLRIIHSLRDKTAFDWFLGQGRHLLSYTKRLTVFPPSDMPGTFLEGIRHIQRLFRLCSSLPQLQILEAPWELLPSCTVEGVPANLTVVIFQHDKDLNINPGILPSSSLATAYRNVQVLDLHTMHLAHRLGNDPPPITFQSLRDLSVRETYAGRNTENHLVVQYISEYWTAPKLDSLSIHDFNWDPWTNFLKRHAAVLKVLSLTTSGINDGLRPEGYEEMTIVFPALRAFYCNRYDRLPSFIAENATRLGVHGVGWVEDEAGDPQSLRERLQDLIDALEYWERPPNKYPNATSYCITGWDQVSEWLQVQPEVINRLKKLTDGGAKVDWIHLPESDPENW